MNNEFEPIQPQASESLPMEDDHLKEIRKQKMFGIKIGAIIAIVVALGFLAYYYKGVFIAATVNGTPISRLAVIKELESVSGKNALDSLITQKLISDEALKKGITVTDEEVSAEITNVENQVKAQGLTLDEALKTQNMTLDILKKQIINQKKLEKILADKLQVTDDEVTQYIKDNKITITKGQETVQRDQIKNQIKQQNFSVAANELVSSLKIQAKINYFVNY